jgi:uncharacterized RDD family membrane protein YckC
MKCPKCDYLGFETGDRCKNCGYDFSLMTDPSPGDGDLLLREPDPFAGPNDWLNQLDRDIRLAPSSLPTPTPEALSPLALDAIAAPTAPAAARAATAVDLDPVVEPPRTAARRVTPPLPLFQPGALDDDEPLIKMPAAPRAPLAVRRTPETPRLRAVPKPARRIETAAAPAEPVLDFQDDPAADTPIHTDRAPAPHAAHASAVTAEASRRLAALALDNAILFSIDGIVIYLTLQMAALTLSDWRMLPVLPLLAFLLLVKGAYFCAFTLVGGQTIGKMAARIRVVTLDGRALDPPLAIRRTLAGALSLLSLGLTFIPVLIAADRRAVHDHVARTRVIAVG